MALGALFLLYRDIIHSLGKWFWHGAAATHTEIARKSRYLEKCTGPLVKEPQQGLTRRMTSPVDLSGYHTCDFCQTMVIDPDRITHPTLHIKAPSGGFFFESTFQDVLTAKSFCSLASWLYANWSEQASRTSNPKQALARWDGLHHRSANIPLCGTVARVSRHVHEDFMRVGLIDPKTTTGTSGSPSGFAACSGDVTLITIAGNAADKFISGRPMNPSPGSPGTMALARSWAEQCLEHHDKCSKPTQSFMPLRVLKCTLVDGRYEVVLDFPSESMPYLALSYCWGGDQPHKTTHERMISEDFNLDWRKLPPSIQDAVKVTIGLGYRFLWVDSLCIVQDHEAEKARQIALMPQIYSNAAITIMASRSEGAARGFLHERTGRDARLAVRLPLRCPGQLAPLSGQRNGFVYALHFENDPPPEPIDYRGWALQERYLSPRILDFGSEQVTWSCHTQNGHLTQPSDGWRVHYLPEAMLRPKLRIQDLQLRDDNSNRCFPGGLSRSETEFYGLVEIYSKRRLSFPADRILAMSGVAAQICATQSDNEYRAGHWVRSLPGSLLWRVEQGQRKPRPAEYQAPSWSWAAVNGGVDFFFARFNMLPETLHLETHVQLVDESAPFGAVRREGRLTGCGTMTKALWFGRQTKYRHSLHRLVAAPQAASLTDPEELAMLQMFPDAMEAELDNKDPYSSVREGETENAICVHLLLVGSLKSLNYFTDTGNDMNGPIGLVLRELDASSVKMMNNSQRSPSVRSFSRLGIFNVHRKRHSHSLTAQDFDGYFDSLFPKSKQERFEII